MLGGFRRSQALSCDRLNGCERVFYSMVQLLEESALQLFGDLVFGRIESSLRQQAAQIPDLGLELCLVLGTHRLSLRAFLNHIFVCLVQSGSRVNADALCRSV